MPTTLRGRLALTYAALIVLLVAGLGAVLVVSIQRLYEDRLSSQLEAQARMAARSVSPLLAAGASGAEVDLLVKSIGQDVEPRISVVLASGSVTGDSRLDPAVVTGLADQPDVADALAASAHAASESTSASVGGVLAVSVPVPEGQGAIVRVALPLTEVNAAVRTLQWAIALGAIAAAAAAGAVAVFVAGRITGPLTDLRDQALAVAAGDLDAAVEPASTVELGDVARAFNSMTLRVRELVDESERSRTRLEAIFRNLADGVIVVDDQGAVIGINAAASLMLGTSADHSVGEKFVVVARDADLERLRKSALDGRRRVTTTIDYARNGRVIEATAQHVAGVGEPLGIVVIRDVTELHRLERVRREFVANVSHELRTPLTSIRAVVETLEAGAIDDPEVAGDFLGRIIGEVDRLAGLVDELLDLARLESGRMPVRIEPTPTRLMVIQAVERLKPQIDRAGLELRTDLPDDLPSVMADRVKIEQVLLNLVHNAIKFTPSGGRVVVSAEALDEEVEIRVADTGVGMNSDDLERAFERFYKSDKARRSEGTGLGLAIAKHLVIAHGGAIRAESVPGEGSLFAFTLPTVPASESIPEALLVAAGQ